MSSLKQSNREDDANPSRLIPPEHIQRICQIGQGELCCRYLMLSRLGFECAKGSPNQTALDERVARGEMLARGDNCEGVYNLGEMDLTNRSS